MENDALLTSKPRNNSGSDGKTSSIFWVKAFVMTAGVMLFAHARLSSNVPNSSAELIKTGPAVEGSVIPTILLSNNYERQSGIALGDGLYKWSHLVEVYAETQVTVEDARNAYTYSWSLTTDGVTQTASGSNVTMIWYDTGFHELELYVTSKSGSTSSFTYWVMSKYVRREIRGLQQKDRERFFNVLEMIYQISQTEGEKAYGKKYRSIERLVSEHLLGAADKMCDHWHDDAGIMTHHIAFTLELEQSLQSIDKAVTVPYWDYTIDAYYYSDWTASPIFDDQWFGTASPKNAEHTITNGRWAYTPVGKQADPDGVRNPYGLLRSPWNTNPTPYILRHRYVYNEKDGGWTIPGCVDFKDAWEYTSLGRYFNELNGELHGPVHIMIGGQWGINISAGYNISYTNGGDFLLASKWLWRQGYLRCPEYCAKDTPAHECTCDCPAELTQGFDSAEAFLSGTGLFALSDGLFETWTNFVTLGECSTPEACYENVRSVLCQVGHAGEMFTSAAPYDPAFWPLHGTADRYLQLKRLLNYKNETTLDTEWTYYHDGNSPSDTHHVCDWDDVGTTMKLPTCYKGDCIGHHKDDLLPMGNFQNNNETYSNEEFFKYVSPMNDDIPYIYDSLTAWPACIEQDIQWWK